MEEIKIVEIVADDITEPRDDGTRGSALYSIPFRLNRAPSGLWAEIFAKVWNNPPQFSSMHRPGIASVVGDKAVLDGTTIEEVNSTHKKTLEICVSEANRIEAHEVRRRREKEKTEQQKRDSFRKDLQKKANEIKFD